jgi:hypothetical protein
MRLRFTAVRSFALIACCLALLVVAAPAAAAPAPFSLGIQDPFAFQGELKGDQLALALRRAREGGATTVRLGVSWRYVGLRKPGSRAEAQSPTWSGYRWEQVDGEVRALTAAGLQPLLAVGIAPEWFEGSGRPSSAGPGTWRPSAEAFGDFARALASRFNGSRKDSAGNRLPRVRYFQAWNEPNIPNDLNPQGKGSRNTSPGMYRSLLKTFYAGVKKARSDNFVVTGGLSPFGNLPSSKPGGSVPPIDFTRELLCVNAAGTSARKCSRVPFDAYALHAYPQADPRENPRNPGDIRLRLSKITKTLKLAARAGTISSRQAKTIWMTELGFSGGPAPEDHPDTQAGYLQLAFYMLWRDGVDNIMWWHLRDRDRGNPVFMGNSGLFARGASVEADAAKPAYTAYRFPVVVFRSGSRTLMWGRAPSSGTMVVEQEGGPAYQQVASFKVGKGRVFLQSVPNPGNGRLRARLGSTASLPVGVTSPAP